MTGIPYEASYRGKAYPSLRQLYLSIDSPEVSKGRFCKAVRAFRDENPRRRLTDKIIESCLTLKRPPILYGRKSYLNLKEVWKAHPGPKPKYETVNMRRWRLFKAVPELVLTESWIEQLFSTPYYSELRRGLVYKLTNRETGLAYVGITGASIEERLKAHLDLSKHGDFSPDGLHEAIRCYGIKSFDLETLHQVEDKEELLALERKEIKRHRTLFPNGYNLDEGGRGWSPRGDLIEFRGRVFASFNQLCRAYDFDPRSVRSRLNYGWSLEEAVDTPKFETKHVEIEIDDKRFETKVKAAEHFGIPITTLNMRIKAGWTTEEALKTPVRGKAKSDYEKRRKARLRE